MGSKTICMDTPQARTAGKATEQINHLFDLTGKTILITGGGSGLGLATAKAVVEAGAGVVIIGRREQVLKDTCDQLGKKATYKVFDLTQTSEIPALVNDIEATGGAIDVLVNNAGILNALSKGELHKKMPVEAGNVEQRKYSTHLEAFGRLMAGMAPWLELGPDATPEGQLRKKYIALALASIKNAVDPSSADFMNFNNGRQPLVDAAFFAEALLRAPTQLWARLDTATKRNTLNALRSSRVITPSYTNWLLFSSTVEAALLRFSGECDKMRVDYAVRQFMLFYKGDGAYGDGPDFHWDYYNSFVIQPMLLETLTELKKADTANADNKVYDDVLSRSRRYAAVLERMISPEATYPPIGRSLAYRFGVFHLLSKIALMQQLPHEVQPQQVRAALYSVIKKQVEAPGTFDKDGWLRIGLYGHQPGIGETYISTGSLYLCSEAFLVLGLPANNAFWQGEDKPWTSLKIWNSEDISTDHALQEPTRK